LIPHVKESGNRSLYPAKMAGFSNMANKHLSVSNILA
jgi:hypothetical protein